MKTENGLFYGIDVAQAISQTADAYPEIKNLTFEPLDLDKGYVHGVTARWHYRGEKAAKMFDRCERNPVFTWEKIRKGLWLGMRQSMDIVNGIEPETIPGIRKPGAYQKSLEQG